VTMPIDLLGKVFSRLSVTRRSENTKGGKAKWECICECGNTKVVSGENLRNGRTKSCGCYGAEVTSKQFKTHGYTKTPTYGTWQAMRKRCTNPRDTYFNYYGGRGITVCDSWNTFANFLEDMGERPKGMTIDRINTNGNYCKDNCKWSTSEEQANNKSNNHNITIDNQTKTLTEWSRIYNIDPKITWKRMNRGWSNDKLFIPIAQ